MSNSSNHQISFEQPNSSHGIYFIRHIVNFLSLAVAMAGVAGNVINIVVFTCQGFKSSINIAFLALSVSDLVTLVVLIFYIFVAWFEDTTSLPILPRHTWHLVGWLLYALAFNNCSIAVYISVERCLSVALPLKVKAIITRKVTVFSVVLIGSASAVIVLPALTAFELKRMTSDDNATDVAIIVLDNFTHRTVTYFAHFVLQ
ncbi:uncharacterized protein LOC101850536, partial [Aplysia californica]|uniref:Uncharacterized protein LOC101850536 n=1 Tax=Aplysia californica TaxID=6500 RepID=A0ABM0KBF4_APLCA